MRRALVPFLLYIALAIASFYPQSLHPTDTVAYVGDPLANPYVIAWNAHQLLRDPIHIFDSPALYPHRRAMLFDEHRLFPSLLVAPVVWITGNAVLAYNVAILIACVFAALGGRRLGRELGLDRLGAWTAGALYAFHTYQINEGARLQILFHGFFPFALVAMIRFLRTGQRRFAWRCGLWLLLQGLTCSYYLLYGVLFLALIVGVVSIAAPAALRHLPRLLLPAVVCALPLLPIGWLYAQAAREYGYARAVPTGIDLEHYVSSSPKNLLYGPIGARVRLQQRGPHFIGFFALGLALWALIDRPRTTRTHGAPRSWIPLAAILALLLVALSLGGDIWFFGRYVGPGPYRLLYAFVPGFQLVGIPERLSLFAMLFTALLVGAALTRLRERGLRVAAATLAAIIPIEHLGPLPVTQRVPVGDAIPAVYRWLARDSAHAVAEVPIEGEGFVRKETIEMYFSSFHLKPIIHGLVTYEPLLTKILRRAAADFPSDVSLEVFQRVGVDTVVVHRDPDDVVALLERVRPRFRAAIVERFHLRAPYLGNRLKDAESAGWIQPLGEWPHPADFDRPDHRDVVYRVQPMLLHPAAPMPTGQRKIDPAWRYHADEGRPTAVADRNEATAWEVRHPLRGDEALEVEFPRPVVVSGIVIPLRRTSTFPTAFEVHGRAPSGEWKTLSQLEPAHIVQLVDQLLASPGSARLGIACEPESLLGVRLMMSPGAESFQGWSIPELEIWTP